MASIMTDIKHRIWSSPAFLSAAVFLFVAYLIILLINRPKRMDLPVIEVHNGDYKSAILHASAKVGLFSSTCSHSCAEPITVS
jgi:hypothetical protein